MYPPHDQIRLPWQVDSHRRQDWFLSAVRQQCWMAWHFALSLPACQKLWVSHFLQCLNLSCINREYTGSTCHLCGCVWNRYKKPEERQPLVAAMELFMPMLKGRFIQLLPDHSSDSVLIQKQIFKILYALFQVAPHFLELPLCWAFRM